MSVNEAVKTIIKHKANKMMKREAFETYIRDVLEEHDIISNETSSEGAKIFVKVFKMGAVDGMMYDVGSALALGRRDNVENWTSLEKRQEMLMEFFCEME
jgi:hypothetical protein